MGRVRPSAIFIIMLVLATPHITLTSGLPVHCLQNAPAGVQLQFGSEVPTLAPSVGPVSLPTPKTTPLPEPEAANMPIPQPLPHQAVEANIPVGAHYTQRHAYQVPGRPSVPGMQPGAMHSLSPSSEEVSGEILESFEADLAQEQALHWFVSAGQTIKAPTNCK